MSKVQIIMSRDIYLDTPVTPITLANPLYVGDNDAQRVRFRVFQQHGDTVPMDLTGVTVMMHFIRPDGGDVVITGTPGTEWSYVDMPQACYAYKGLFAFSVHLISDDQTATTVMKACGQLDKVTTDTIIDPGHVIPSLEELLAKLDDMDDAVTACNAAAAAADAAADNANAAVSYLAPVYSAESTYNAGEYVIQDGKLYRCTADISTAEAWTAAHWTEVVFGDEISNLKSAFIPIMDNSNLFDPTQAIDGKYLNGSGNLQENSNSYSSAFIKVEPQTQVEKNSPIVDNFHRLCVYDANKALIPGELHNENIINIPANGAYVRFCGLLTEKETAVLKLNTAKDLIARNRITALDDYVTNKFESFTEEKESINLFDGNFTKGYYIGTNGNVVENETYEYSTNYIPVNANDVLSWWYYSTTLKKMTSATIRFLTAYDSDFQAVTSAGINSATHTYTVPTGIAYIRFTYQINSTDTTVMAVKGTTEPVEYLPYTGDVLVAKPSFLTGYNVRSTMEIKAAEGITVFYEKMMEAYNTKNVDVYIGKGTYTYTNELIDAIRAAGYRGIPIGNGCRYFFETGAYLYCEYTGQNAADVVDLFSPLDSWNLASDWEFHNLHIVAKNVVYALHDEANGEEKFCRHYYENCYLELDNSALGAENGNAISKALGGGLGAHEEVIIRNCVFKAVNPAHTTPYQNDASYHGANRSAYTDASIVVDGCYFENIFRGSNLNVNVEAPYPRIIYTNNSCSGRKVDLPGNWTVREWNNEIRSN